MPITKKIDSMVTYLQRLLPVKSNDYVMTQYCDIT